MKIAVYGYGTVARGFIDILKSYSGGNFELLKIVVKDRDKKRDIKPPLLCFEKDDILRDKDINLVIELIDDADDAYDIVVSAMRAGKNVISANKKMIAGKQEELIKISENNNVSFLYDASVGGGIAIIRNLEDSYSDENIKQLGGILNASSNYILSQMHNTGVEYSEALKVATEKGFAESNPALDVEGIDSKYKLVILVLHAFGLPVDPDDIFTWGISNIIKQDIRFAKKKGSKIKLIASAEINQSGKLVLSVMPHFITLSSLLYSVEDESNGIIGRSVFLGEQFFYGKGAGGYPTGASVFTDLDAISNGHVYKYKKYRKGNFPDYTKDHLLEVYLRSPAGSKKVMIKFISVSESWSDNEYDYIIAVTNLKDLYNKREELKEKEYFLAVTSQV